MVLGRNSLVVSAKQRRAVTFHIPAQGELVLSREPLRNREHLPSQRIHVTKNRQILRQRHHTPHGAGYPAGVNKLQSK
jgi:hypothetical protein